MRLRCACGNLTEKSHIKKSSEVIYKSVCRTCRGRTDLVEYKAIYHKKWRESNHQYVADYKKEWQQENGNHLNKYKSKWVIKQLDKGPIFKLAKNLRSRMNNALRGNYKTGSAIRDLGCSIDELKKHLESKFQEGMSWNNYGLKGWHIDHIKPLALYNLENHEEFKKACHYSNLQPLWAKDNLSWGAKVKENLWISKK